MYPEGDQRSWETHIQELLKVVQTAAEQGNGKARGLLNGFGPEAEAWLLRSGNSLFLLEEFKPKPVLASCVAGEPVTGVGWLSPTRLGRFEIIRELGRGGGGIVFLVVDPFRADRVALKVPRPEILIEPVGRRRFLRESQLAETLQHPAIIRVLEVGQIGLICYIVSDYCEGPDLAHWLATRTEPVDPRGAAALVASLAEGVAYAHEHKVLHRDIKPSNVLLEWSEGGCEGLNVTPKLLDFGMAKFLTGPSDDISQSGTIVGTARYMAPEQAASVRGSVSEKIDVYSLGAILYELLVGQPPYDVHTLKDLLTQLANSEPTPLRRLRPEISSNLEIIVRRCLAKDPRQRCASAAQLARNLRLYLAGQPIELRRPSNVSRMVAWVRQHRYLPTELGIFAVLFCLLFLGRFFPEAVLRDRTASVMKRDYVAEIRAAAASRDDGDINRARTLLVGLSPQPGEPDEREFTWYHFWQQGTSSRTLIPPDKIDGNKFLIFSPDSGMLAIVGDNLTLWNLEKDQAIDTPTGVSVSLTCVSFSHDCASLAVGGSDGSIRVWTISEKLIVLDDSNLRAPMIGLSFSTDGRILYGSSQDGRLWSWDLKTHELRPMANDAAVRSEMIFWGPDCKFAISIADDAIIFQDVINNLPVWKDRASSRPLSLAAEPNLTKIVTGNQQGEIIIRNGDNGTLQTRFHNRSGPVRALAISADGRTIASAGWGPSVTLWDARTGQRLTDLEGPCQQISSVGFAPDNQWLAAAGPDGTLRIWSAPR